MRTREEQIREIAAVRDEVNPTRTGVEAEKWAEQHILEAERRAEQRVRAEIGRDSERLDWLADMKVGVEYREEFGWGVYEILEGMIGEAPTLRKAIDAAMEDGK